MKRTLRFWTLYAWESAELILGCLAVLSVLTILGAEGLRWDEFAATIPYYIMFSVMMCSIMVGMGTHTLYLPLLLAMGETRRNVLYGYHYYRALVIAAALAACAVIWLAVPGEMSGQGLRSLPTILVLLIIASTLGSLSGTCFTRWKWVSLAIILVLSGGFGGIIGFLGAGGFNKIEGAMTWLSKAMVSLPWQLVLAAAALLVMDVVFQWQLLRRQEVKL